MGYKRNPKVYHLKFEGEYDGLEVRVRSLSMGQLIAARTDNDDGGRDGTEAMVELLAERLVDWNLEDEDGAPVPPTLDAIKGEDHDMIMAIITQWTNAVAGVPAPLEQPSPAGETSPVASIPTEALSPSLAS
ncbi:hypothetical protein [Streptomyces sp. BK340]|uniref:hypothetical protein n=1 Tax=Streptomyces sp. BK340 TaxID=2572903 RepID=UPI00119D967D|nr:hypothetical protein [Streptomyces sp. BK340]TVZ96525.1 hypothetical protein FB157_103436 [Streptomyces sp. BK340]